MEELRLYSFQNFYLKGIHAGIQTAHTIAEMSTQTADDCYHEYTDWADNHKTIVVLNGGMQKDLEELLEFLGQNSGQFFYGWFHEESGALNGALTNVSIIVPERIFNFKKNTPKRYIRPWYVLGSKTENPDYIRYMREFSDFEIKLASYVNNSRLMD